MTTDIRRNAYLRDELRCGLLAILIAHRSTSLACGSLADYDAGFVAAVAAMAALVGIEDDDAIGRALTRRTVQP